MLMHLVKQFTTPTLGQLQKEAETAFGVSSCVVELYGSFTCPRRLSCHSGGGVACVQTGQCLRASHVIQTVH